MSFLEDINDQKLDFAEKKRPFTFKKFSVKREAVVSNVIEDGNN